MDPQQILSPSDTFVHRHIGPTDADIQEMLATLGFQSLDALLSATVPDDIRLRAPLALGPHRGEYDVLADLRSLHDRNKIFRSFLGMGYHDCPTPPLIPRNILEKPGWYTQYPPHQAEIAQGRLEALLNFQTLVADLTGLPLANASLLDEATAAAEAMAMCRSIAHKDQDRSSGKDRFFVAEDCHPQTIAVLRTRAHPLGITLQIGRTDQIDFSDRQLFGVLLQYPTTDGVVREYSDLVTRAHAEGAPVAVATDLLALTLLRPPGEFGADIAIGSSQRFGVSLGFGGPHAAFLSAKDDYKRHLPGRIVGVSKDANGKPAYRLALQTREQHIRRDKATSNICTAQVLLAVMASMYAVYHGPEGLRAIAERVHRLTSQLADGLHALGCTITHEDFFDTISVEVKSGSALIEHAQKVGCNLRPLGPRAVAVSLDETTTPRDIRLLMSAFRGTT